MGDILDDGAIGFSIEIPEKVFTDLTKLDDKIAVLQKTANSTAESVINSFLKIGVNGINPLINKISELQTKINGLSLSKLQTNISGDSKNIDEYTNSIIKLAEILNRFYSENESKKPINITINTSNSEKLQVEINKLRDNYDKLYKAFDKYKTSKINDNKLDKQSEKALNAYNRAMAASEATLNQRINKLAKLRNAQEQLNKTNNNYSKELTNISNETARLNKLNEQTVTSHKKIQNSQNRTLDTTAQLQRRLALVFSVSQITSYLLKLRDVRAEFELQNKSLEVLLKNKLEADRLFNQIAQLAVQSPFTVKELISYTKQLAAYQVEEKELYNTTKMLADVAAGLGVDMNRLILAFGQVKAANFLKGTEVRQFTEAGLNILGELAKYYTELEGRMVSIVEVQEMVTKRMVSFGDVQEIFKRVTSEGGLFYKIQEQQAETLAGQISNLKDSIDLMLNDIGKANDGVLKGMISAIKSIVENWRTLETVLKAVGVGMAVYVAKTTAATLITNKLLKSTNAVEQRLGAIRVATGVGASKNISKLSGAFKGLWGVLKANPLAIVVTAVAAVGSAIYNNYKRVQEAREEYEKFSIETEKTASKISKIKDELSSVSGEIDQYKDTLSGLQEGTDEYEKVQNKLNDKIKTQTGLFNQLKTDYPEIYAGLVNQKAGTEELTEAAEQYVKTLRQAIVLNNLLSEDAGKKKKDIKLVAESYAETQGTIDDLGYQIEAQYLKVYNAIQKALLDPGFADKYQSIIDDIIKSDKDYYDKLYDLTNFAFSNVSVRNNKYIRQALDWSIIDKFKSASREAASQTQLFDRSIQNLIDNVLVLSGVMSADDFMNLPEEKKEETADFIRSFIEDIPSIQDEAVKKFVFDKIKITLGIELDEKQITKELGNVQKRINAYIEKYNLESKNVIDLITFDETPDAYFDDLAEKYDLLTKEQQKLKTATEEVNEEGTNKERLKIVQQELANILKISTAFGYGDKLLKGNKKTNEDDSQIWKEKINLITKAYDEYKKFRKYYGEDESASLVRENLKKSFEDNEIGNILATMSFDPSGVINALMTIGAMAGGKMNKEIQTAIDNVQPDIALNVKIAEVDKLQSDIDNLFSSYDLATTLKKEGVDESLIKQLFGVEIFNIEDLTRVLESYRSSLGNLGEEQVKIFDNAENKIADLQNKAIEDRMKLYVSLLKKSVSQRINIELEAQNKINKIWSESALTSTQKSAIADNIIQQMQKELDSLSWDEFKGSNTYVSLFEDIETASDTALKVMRDRLLQVRESLNNLDPSDLKEILKRLQEIDNELIERNPFANFGENIRTYINYLRERNDLEEQYANSVAKEDTISGQISDIEESVIGVTTLYNTYSKLYGLDDERTIKLREQLDNYQSTLDNLREQLEVQQDITSETENQIREGERSKENLVGSLSDVSQITSSLTSAIPEIASNLENIFGEMSQETSDALDTTVGIIDGIGTTAEGVMNIVSGNPIQVVQGVIQAISGLTQIIGEAFAAGDKAIERQIQDELDKVETLERAYEDLRDAQDNAISLKQINANQRAIEDNLNAQIDAYEKAISLEKSKKKVDKDTIEEYTDQLEDAKKQLQQEKIEYIEMMGGYASGDSMTSAAESFASAWLDAFLETGDGLSVLQDEFDEYFKNIIVKQASLKLLGGYLEPLFDDINNLIDQQKAGTITESEFKEGLADRMDYASGELSDRINEYLKIIFGSFGYKPGELATPELSGLTQGIQSITEETALALESLLNSMRYTMMEDNVTLKSILVSISSQDTLQNPILGEMKTQTKLITDIKNIFTSIVTVHPTLGGKCIKISM